MIDYHMLKNYRNRILFAEVIKVLKKRKTILRTLYDGLYSKLFLILKLK